MTIHIKQLKGANDLIERDEFVKNNLIGKMKLKDGNLMLSVPLKIEKTVEDTASDFSLLNENDFVTKEYVDTSISALKGDVSANYDTLREIEDNIRSISAATGADPVSAESKSSTGIEIGSISIGDNTVTFYIDLSNYVEKSGENAAFTTVPTAPSISSAYDDNKLVTASFVHEVERKLIGAIDDDTIEVLTTLSDISAAINNDPEYYSTVQEALNAKLNKSDISVIPESSTGTLIGKIILDEDTYEFKVDLSALDFFNSPNFTGEPTVPDIAQGNSSSLIANTRFVTTAVSDAISSVKGAPPDDLNTLQKISTAIGNNSAFAANVNSSLSTIDSTVSTLNAAVSSAVESIDSVNNNKQPLNNALTSISSLPTEADRMIYTTAKDSYAVTTLTGSARTLISQNSEQDMRDYLSVPQADGTGASGTWSITADKALKDKDGNPIDTTYLKTDDVVNVSVSNLVTGTDVTRLGTITIGDDSHDINVDLTSYASLNSPIFTGAPTAPSPTLTDDSTRIATTGFVQSVVSGAIDDLVGEGTPEALDTLKEIADIIGSDADFTGSIITELSNKVSKEIGKGLSTNDFTTEEKNKLSSIEAGANNYSLPVATTTTKGGVIVGTGLSVKDGKVSLKAATDSTIGGIKLGNGVTTATGGVVSIQSATTDQNGLMTKEQVSKLNSIAAGAEVNVINHVKVNDAELPISDKTVTIDLTDYVQKDGTKVLSDNNYTTEEKSKLASIEAGAQVNKIDAVKVNGTFVEPDSNKVIEITVSGGGDYILPNATTTNKGGIIVGNGLAVNNATVSVATATTSKIGGIKLGNGVTTTTDGTVSIRSATASQNGLMTSDQASKLAGITAGAEVNTINIVKVNGASLTPDINKAIEITVPDISDKVDKVVGKGLSTNDYTTDEKSKLAGIATGANNYSLPNATTTTKGGVIVGTGLSVSNSTLSVATATTSKIGGIRLGNGVTTTTGGIVSIQSATASQNGLMTSDQASKLASIATGAQVNTINTIKVNGTALTPDSNKAVEITVPDISDKVDKVTGKGLSTNDFTKSYKDKLDSIEAGATKDNVFIIAGTASSTINTAVTSNPYINLTDNNVKKGSVQIKGDGVVSVSSDSSGVITVKSTNTTYSNASSIASGLLPTLSGNKDQYLRGDGSWVKPPNITYSAGTGISLTGTNNTIISADAGYLGSIAKGTDATKFLNSKGQWAVPPNDNTTYSGSNGISVSSTVISADSNYVGSVQKDTLNASYNKFLKADGTWATPIAFGTCSTAADVSAKTVTISTLPDTNIPYGTVIYVMFQRINTAEGMTLQVNNDTTRTVVQDGNTFTDEVFNTSANNQVISFIKAKIASIDTWRVIRSHDAIMKGADASTAGKVGLVPAPVKGDQDKFLKADGTWATPPDTNTTYSSGTGINVSSDNKINLVTAKSGTIGGVKVAAVATSNINLNSDGGISVPLATTSQAGAVKVGTNLSVNNGTVSLSSTNVTDALGFTPAAADVMTGASASASGKAGLVPVQAKGDQDKFLKGNGTWADATKNAVSLVAGASKGTINAAVTSPYINLVDNTTNKGSLQITGGTAVTVSSSAAGVITIKSSDTTYNTVTTSNNGLVPKLPSTDAASLFLNGEGSWTTVSSGTANNVSLVAAATATGTLNATSAVGNTYLNLTDNNAVKGSVKIIGSGSVSVKSSTAGTIEISGTDTNTDTNDKVAQSVSTDDNTYPILLSSKANATTSVSASNVIFGKGVKVNPSTNEIVLSTVRFNSDVSNYVKDSTLTSVTFTQNNVTATSNVDSSAHDMLINSYAKLFIMSGDEAQKRFGTISDKYLAYEYDGSANPIDLAPHKAFYGHEYTVHSASSVSGNANTLKHINIASDRSIVFYTNLAKSDDAMHSVEANKIPAGNIKQYKFAMTYTGQFQAPMIQTGYIQFKDEVYAANTGAVTLGNSSSITSIQALDGFTSLPSGLYTMKYRPDHNHWCNVISTRQRGGIGSFHANYGMQIVSDMLNESDLYWRQQINDTVWTDVKTIVDNSNLATQLKNINSPEFTGTVKAANISLSNPLPISLGGTGVTSGAFTGVTVSGKTITFTKGDGTTVTVQTQDTDTNDKVAQKVSTTSNTFPVLLTGTANAINDVAASNVIFGSGVKVNPKTGTFVAPYVSVGTNLTAASISGDAVYYTTGTAIALDRSTAAAKKKVMTVEALAYWNGALNASDNISNLAYCKLGTFGTAATTDASIYPSLASENTFTAQINLGTEKAPGYLRVPKYGSVGLGSKGAAYNGLMMLEHQESHTSKSDVLLKSTQNLFLASGGQFFDAYGISTVASSISSDATTENIYLISDGGIHFWTGFKSSTKSAMSLNSSGVLTVPQLALNTALSTMYGGTGTNNLANVSVGSAGKATLDGSGHTITSYYAPLDSPTFTGTVKGANVSLSGTVTMGSADAPGYLRLPRRARVGMGSVGNGFNGLTLLDEYMNSSGTGTGYYNVLMKATKNLFLVSGNSFFNAYGKNTVPNSISADASGESMYLLSNGAIQFWSNFDDTTGKQMTFSKSGILEVPKLSLTTPLDIANGGTGVTSQSDLMDALGISTVSSDIALQAMGFGNGTGCYTCNISPTNASLTNDTTSPMDGFTLKDGVTVYFCLKNTVSAATKTMFMFNGTPIHSAYSIKSGVSTSTVPASVLTTGFYKAIYHTSALSSSDAHTWIFHKIN